MTNRRRIPASECRPGKYKATDGGVIVLVRKATARWGLERCRAPGSIPYKRLHKSRRGAKSTYRFWSYGWLSSDYLLLAHNGRIGQ